MIFLNCLLPLAASLHTHTHKPTISTSDSEADLTKPSSHSATRSIPTPPPSSAAATTTNKRPTTFARLSASAPLHPTSSSSSAPSQAATQRRSCPSKATINGSSVNGSRWSSSSRISSPHQSPNLSEQRQHSSSSNTSSTNVAVLPSPPLRRIPRLLKTTTTTTTPASPNLAQTTTRNSISASCDARLNHFNHAQTNLATTSSTHNYTNGQHISTNNNMNNTQHHQPQHTHSNRIIMNSGSSSRSTDANSADDLINAKLKLQQHVGSAMLRSPAFRTPVSEDAFADMNDF